MSKKEKSVVEKTPVQVSYEKAYGALVVLNEAMKKNDLKAVNVAEATLKEAEKEYAKDKMVEVFDELFTTDNPVLNGIKQRTFDVVTHKPNKVDGKVVGYTLEPKKMNIDLVKLCAYCHLDTSWQFMVEKFNQLVTLRIAKEINVGKEKIDAICKSYYMQEKARELDMGETPTSNNQIKKMLQSIVDKIIFEDDGKGNNKYVVRTCDANYVIHAHMRDTNDLALKAANHSVMHKIVAKVCHGVVMNKAYDVLIQERKKDDDAGAKAPAEKVSKTEKEAKKVSK